LQPRLVRSEIGGQDSPFGVVLLQYRSAEEIVPLPKFDSYPYGRFANRPFILFKNLCRDRTVSESRFSAYNVIAALCGKTKERIAVGMKRCIISTPSATYAMRIEKTLLSGGIAARATRLERRVSAKGCAFGVELDCEAAERALSLLDRGGLPYGVLIKRQDRI